LPVELRINIYNTVIAESLPGCWLPRYQADEDPATYTIREPDLMQLCLSFREEVEVWFQAALKAYSARLGSMHGRVPQKMAKSRARPPRRREVLRTHHQLMALATYLGFAYEISLASCGRLDGKDETFAAMDLVHRTYQSRAAYVTAAIKVNA
ncbi:hypothetical protein LTR95_017675, partial [Oleoguttula sp. CCFEE 5521]